MAVLNYVIHAGGGFDNKGGARYINSYEELIKQVIALSTEILSHLISNFILIILRTYLTIFISF